MSFQSLLIHNCTIYNKTTSGSTDIYNNPITGFDAGVASKARFDPATPGNPGRAISREFLEDRDTTITTWHAFFPVNAPLEADSEVVWTETGFRFRVDGRPAEFADAVGPHHLEAKCTLIED
jgi:hypothetical protein